MAFRVPLSDSHSWMMASPAETNGTEAGNGGSGPVCEPPTNCITQNEFGLNMACFEFVFRSWSAMQQGDASIVLVDARTEDDYTEEHIAGAVLVNYYQQKKYLPDVMPLLEVAQAIFIYCAGGDCEDSQLLANSLIYEHDLPSDVVYVYEGGIAEWIAKGQPLGKGGQP